MTRVLIAGGTGAIGRPLVSALALAGYEVVATTRNEEKVPDIEAAGATADVVDLLTEGAATDLIERVRPEVVIDELTSLPQDFDPRKAKSAYAANDRVRRDGGGALISASQANGVKRYVMQSVAFLYRPGAPGLRVESDPVWDDAPEPFRASVEVLHTNEVRVVDSKDFDGIVLRYGFLYGPGTWYADDGSTTNAIRRRQYPLIGNGAGVNSMVHVSDAVQATARAVERGSGVYNIVDDDPAPMSEMIPAIAELLGAKPPRRLPKWLGRVAAGGYLVEAATRMPGASNEKARAELLWQPQIGSWRTGMAELRPRST